MQQNEFLYIMFVSDLDTATACFILFYTRIHCKFSFGIACIVMLWLLMKDKQRTMATILTQSKPKPLAPNQQQKKEMKLKQGAEEGWKWLYCIVCIVCIVCVCGFCLEMCDMCYSTA